MPRRAGRVQHVVELALAVAALPVAVQKQDHRPPVVLFEIRRQVDQGVALGVQCRALVGHAKQLRFGPGGGGDRDQERKEEGEEFAHGGTGGSSDPSPFAAYFNPRNTRRTRQRWAELTM